MKTKIPTTKTTDTQTNGQSERVSELTPESRERIARVQRINTFSVLVLLWGLPVYISRLTQHIPIADDALMILPKDSLPSALVTVFGFFALLMTYLLLPELHVPPTFRFLPGYQNQKLDTQIAKHVVSYQGVSYDPEDVTTRARQKEKREMRKSTIFSIWSNDPSYFVMIVSSMSLLPALLVFFIAKHTYTLYQASFFAYNTSATTLETDILFSYPVRIILMLMLITTSIIVFYFAQYIAHVGYRLYLQNQESKTNPELTVNVKPLTQKTLRIMVLTSTIALVSVAIQVTVFVTQLFL